MRVLSFPVIEERRYFRSDRRFDGKPLSIGEYKRIESDFGIM